MSQPSKSLDNSEIVVTGLITVYNGASHIAQSIESLLMQSLRNIEVLVIDDCSSDSTVDVIKSIDDSRVRLIASKERLKRAKALMLGCDEAKGQFIAILDADDYAYPERLEKQVAFLHDNPECVWVGSAEERVDSQRHEHVVRQYPLNDEGMRRMASKCIPYCHSAVMFRKNLIEQGHNYDPSVPYLIDFEFFIRVARLGKVANLPDKLAKRDIRHESYFQGQFKRKDQNRYLAQLGLKAVSEFKLPPWYAFNPLARLVYPRLPVFMQKLARFMGGIKDKG
ncbi:glycosyltransferase family 2 protein [Rubritalea tangerina]|uniref:Glycosyltransferase family 2 protein n=1 Tax=Rubritalea tangerina TaxID=430798 RepID=A0ABW4ZAD7_9BACT